MSAKTEKIVALSQKQMLIKRTSLWFGRELGDSDYPFSTQKSIALREIQDNAIDAVRKTKKGGNIRIVINSDYSFECYDSGPGIPTEIGKTSDGRKASSIYLALGVMNAGSNYENVTDSLGTNGVGGSGAQLLSEYTKVEVYRDKKRYRLDFKNGEPGIFDGDKFIRTKDLKFLKVEKDSRPASEKRRFPTGTKITVKLNDNLFKSKFQYNADDLIERLKGVAFLVPDLDIEIINHLRILEDGSPQTEHFNFKNGLEQLLDLHVDERLTPIHVLSNRGTFTEASVNVSNGKAVTVNIEKEISVDLAFTYSNSYDYFLDSYANTIKTRLHGFHTLAFERALVETFNTRFRSMRGGLSRSDEDPIFADYSEGLGAVVSVSIPEPEFTNQIKEELGGKKALKEFTKLFSEVLDKWVNARENQDVVKVIADKVITASKNRIKIKDQQAIRREKARLERSVTMPTKLADCEITHDKDSELFILEGDSALGGLKAARNSQFQALLPIRGKILNILKTDLKSALKNKEVQDIIKCLDAGIGKDFDMSKSRYGRVIIAADADPDGANISCLLLVLFWTLFPDLVKSGNLYKACTPLFIVKEGSEIHYCFNKEEYDTLMNRLSSSRKKISVTRAKGLGEAGSEALFETGMNPETRIIERITAEDIEDVEKWLEISMGKNVEPRKKWIEDNPLVFDDIID